MRTWVFEGSSVVFRSNGLFGADGQEMVDASLPVPYHIVHSVIAAALLITIFLYGNRPRQARVVRGIWLITMLMAGMQYISSNSIDAYLKAGGSFGIAFFLPIGTVLFAILAERAIKKDEALVKSADRLR